MTTKTTVRPNRPAGPPRATVTGASRLSLLTLGGELT